MKLSLLFQNIGIGVIKEGSVAPPTLKSERQFEKVKLFTGLSEFYLNPFLKNLNLNLMPLLVWKQLGMIFLFRLKKVINSF